MKINKRMHTLKKYVVSKRVSDPKLKKLDWNECSVEIDDALNKFFMHCLQEIKFSEYPEIKNKKLLKKIAEYCDIDQQNIEVFNGSDSALKYIFEVFVDEDISVLVFNPNYSQINTYIRMQTNKLYFSDIQDIFGQHKYNFDDIENHDVVYISNPNNPTGHVLLPSTIEKIVKENPKKMFIVDEAYYEFCKLSCVELIKKYDNLIVTRTFSKAFGLASARLGYMCSSVKNINIVNKIKNHKEVNSFAQNLGIVALNNIDMIEKRVNKVNKNKNAFCYDLKKNNIEYVDSKSNFVLLKTKKHKTVLKQLLENNILVRDRSYMDNLESCIRVTIGEQKDMDKIIEILESNNE